MKTNSISIIMTRVWLIFSYRLATALAHNLAFWCGVGLVASVTLVASALHIASIWQNLLSTPVGQVPGFLYHSSSALLASGDLVKIFAVLLLLVLSVMTLRVLRRVTFITRSPSSLSVS